MSRFRILVVNPRTTFTKIAIFDNEELVYLNKVNHTQDELDLFHNILDQHEYRKNIVLKELQEADIAAESIHAVVGRGGLIKPVKSGVFEINDHLIEDLTNSPVGEDSVNLGGLIAKDIADSLSIKAYTCDPVVVDELDDLARIAGHPDFERKSVFHALNQKAVARRYANSFSKKVEELNLIVAHIGIGITIGAHHFGRVIDVNQGYDGEGPFTPKRSGTLPMGDLIRMCYSGQFSEEEMLKKITGKGGMTAYFGTDDMKEIAIKAQNGDKEVKLIFDAMAYQVSKYIGMMIPVLKGNVDAILLTGGITNNKYFVDQIIERVEKIALVHVYPEGDEMESLAKNVLAVLRGERDTLLYE
ncbi:MAG: butyrate kinase [Bacteroidetes bacterium]|jgi:butyrate kinase|nr:butyrate kinase [Bacteroidota bacterium]MBT5529431.1 butyrate kinase [Cytophagia bacterium]MBT3424108.1 butyrate kinase [Bacteroidota bacterium]MBT3935194.1 butyrate kinase [Bacteroidota bacterium]MBT4337816.1 butyrate kinase [Bacteroidota bacterium]